MVDFKVIVMSGIPGSGKSTYIKRNKKPDDIVISRDAIRFEMLEPADEYFSKEQKVKKKFYDSIIHNITHNPDLHNIYIDATHLTQAGRHVILDILAELKPQYNFAVIIVYMDTPLYICQQQNRQRTGRASA